MASALRQSVCGGQDDARDQQVNPTCIVTDVILQLWRMSKQAQALHEEVPGQLHLSDASPVDRLGKLMDDSILKATGRYYKFISSLLIHVST